MKCLLSLDVVQSCKQSSDVLKMDIQLKKWGDSVAFPIPRNIAEQIGVDENSTVELTATENGFSIKPKSLSPTIDELLSSIPDDFQYPDDITDFVNSDALGREQL